MTRVFSATVFLAAALAFTLPFGVVTSCDGAEVRFTGTELATFAVPAADSSDAELRDSLEHGASLFAMAALVAAGLGLALSIAGRSGAGVCAAAGLVAIQLVLYGIVAASDGGDVYAGFWLALASFVVAGMICLIREIRARCRSTRSIWPAIGFAVAVVLPPLGLVVSGFVELIVLAARAARRAIHPPLARPQ